MKIIKTYYDKEKGYTLVEYVCSNCKEHKIIRKEKLKKKKYDLCNSCYNKSDYRKITAQKIVSNRRSFKGKKNPNFKGLISFTCPCGNPFQVEQSRKDTAKYCSNDCRHMHNVLQKTKLSERNKISAVSGKDNPLYTSIELACRCGNKFTVNPYRIKRSKNVYCSRKCSDRFKIVISKHILYKDIKFRSSWEVKYAQYLDSLGYSWKYEPEAFETPVGYYTPDFWVQDINSYVEVKGFFRDQNAKEKFDYFGTKYPIVLVNKEWFKAHSIGI